MRSAASALALLLVVSISGILPRPVMAAGPKPPWLTPVAEDAGDPMVFQAFSDDGTHLFVTGSDPITHQGPAGIWDFGAYSFHRVTPEDVAATFANASADGSSVIFLTKASLVPEDPGEDQDLYRVKNGVIDLVSLGTSEGVDRAWWVSDDGTRVLFDSGEALTPDDPTVHDDSWYFWEEGAPTLRLLSSTLASYGPTGMTGTGDRILVQEPDGSLYDTAGGVNTFLATGGVTRLSPDETLVYITSRDRLVPEDTDAVNDAYVLGPGGPRLLSPNTPLDVGLVAVSDDGASWVLQTDDALLPEDHDIRSDAYLATDDGLELLPSSDENAWVVATTGDLSTMVIRTQGRATSADTDDGEDLYRWDAGQPSVLTLLSSGTDSHIPTHEQLSSDGTRVIFETEEPMVAEASDDRFSSDVYEWWNGAITNLGPGAATDVLYRGSSADGRRVAFVTAANLGDRLCTPGPDLFLSDRQIQPPSRSLDDVTPPVGTITIANGAAVVPSPRVMVSVPAVDAGLVTHVALSNNGIDWITSPYNYYEFWTLGPTSGPATVYAKWQDLACNWSVPIFDTVVIAAPPLSSTPPVAAPISATSILSGSIQTRLTWSSPDPATIERWELEQQTDTGPWTPVDAGLSSPTAILSIRLAHSYTFRVRAVDHVGHIGDWAVGSPTRISGYSESGSAVKYVGAWSTATSTVYWGGKVKASSQAGAKATFTFTGRSVALVSRLAPGRGKAEIWVGSTKVATIDLVSTGYTYQRIVWSKTWSTSAKRTVTVKVLGTSGRPRVDIDGFIVGS